MVFSGGNLSPGNPKSCSLLWFSNAARYLPFALEIEPLNLCLLKSTGLHVNGEFADVPSNEGIMPLWDACEEFLKSTTFKPRKISELIKKLSAKPYKLKQGFLDFWIPTYLYIKKQDFSLYGTNGAYIPNINMEFFELLQKHSISCYRRKRMA